MISFLRSFYQPRYLRDALKHSPAVKGHLRLEYRERGKLKQVSEGDNIWTLTGREFLAELMALDSIAVRTPFREDRIAHIGLGIGAQPEVSNITSLVSPVAYTTGQYLATLAMPATFPITGTDAARTAVQFTREFGRNEISLGFDVVLTEAGLFTDGDPDNSWSIPAPTTMAGASGRAPMAYKNFEPITKTTNGTLRTIWEVRLV